MKTKEITKLIIKISLFFICVNALFVWIPNKLELERNSGVSIGEFWMYDSGNENPLKKEEIRCYKVLDVKNGYVKYLKLPDGYISSSTVRSFKFKSKKIK